jgi:hypothetical protein
MSAALKKLVLHYRFICKHCVEVSDVPEKDVRKVDGIGSGRDIDGSYDSGYSETRVKCTVCGEENRFSGSIDQSIKDERLFKKFMSAQ